MTKHEGFIHLKKIHKQWRSQLHGDKKEGVAVFIDTVNSLKRCDSINDCDVCTIKVECVAVFDHYCGCPVLTNTFVSEEVC